jgi:uncharacterized membrane protein (DUF106 family)
MGKIVGFVLATIGLSLTILIPTYAFFDLIATKVQKIGIFSEVISFFWQGFALIVFVVVVIVGTMIALIIWGDKKHVL